MVQRRPRAGDRAGAGRGRRPQRQGSAQPAGRRTGSGRLPGACRLPGRAGHPRRPGTGGAGRRRGHRHEQRPARRLPPRAPPRPGGGADPRQRRHPPAQARRAARSTGCCSPVPASTGSARRSASASGSTRASSSPPRARARSRSRPRPGGAAADACAPADHAATRAAAVAERAVLGALGGGCLLPLGAWARVEAGRLVVTAALDTGGALRRAELAGDVRRPRGAGGAGRREAPMSVPSSRPLAGRRVLVTRAAGQASSLSQELRQLGAAVVEVPAIADPAGGAAGGAARRGPLAARAPAATLDGGHQRQRRRGTARARPPRRPRRHARGGGRRADRPGAARASGSTSTWSRRGPERAPWPNVSSPRAAGSGAVWLPQAEAARTELGERLRHAGPRSR